MSSDAAVKSPPQDLVAVERTLRGAPKMLDVVAFLVNAQIANGGEETPLLLKAQLADSVDNPPKNLSASLWYLHRYGIVSKVRTKHGRGGGSVYSVHRALHGLVIRLASRGVSRRSINVLEAANRSPQPATGQVPLQGQKDVAARISERLQRCGLEEHKVGANDLMPLMQNGTFQKFEDLLDSINHIAFYLTQPESAGIKNPKAWVVAQLRKGYYGPPPGFKSWDEQQAELKLAATRQKTQRLREFQRQQFDADFELWFLEHSDDERRALLGNSIFARDPQSPGATALLRGFYCEQTGRINPYAEHQQGSREPS